MKKIAAWLLWVALAGLSGQELSAQGRAQPEQAALSLPAELQQFQPTLALRGRSTLTFLGMDIYEARLWTAPAFALEKFEQHPFALELQYRRSLTGRLIARRSLAEMQRQSGFDPQRANAWLAQMESLFPDVKQGERITGIYLPDAGARFVVNGQPVGEIADPLFARLFFGIWLSAQTSEPAMRCALAVCPSWQP